MWNITGSFPHKREKGRWSGCNQNSRVKCLYLCSKGCHSPSESWLRSGSQWPNQRRAPSSPYYLISMSSQCNTKACTRYYVRIIHQTDVVWKLFNQNPCGVKTSLPNTGFSNLLTYFLQTMKTNNLDFEKWVQNQMSLGNKIPNH